MSPYGPDIANYWILSVKKHRKVFGLKPRAGSLLCAAVLLLMQPIQIEEVDPVFQIGCLNILYWPVQKD